MAGVPAASIAGNMVVTPEMVPPNPAPYDEEATFFNTLADDAEDTQKQWNAGNTAREQSAQSPGFEEGHEKNRQVAADFGRLAGVYRDAGTYYSSVAGVYRDAHRSQQSAINNANNELRQAKTPAEQQAIIARWHAHARSLTDSAIAEAAQKAQTFQTNAGSDITALDSRTKAPRHKPPRYPKVVETASPCRSGKLAPVYRMNPKATTARRQRPTVALTQVALGRVRKIKATVMA